MICEQWSFQLHFSAVLPGGDATRARNGSFGLGLAIAQSIVLRHRGRIWATSGQGVNTFQVELPVA